MTEWRSDIENAPRDGPFLALNHDYEVWVAMLDQDGRLAFRMNHRREPRMFQHVVVDGETLLREDREYAERNETWDSHWTLWARLYEFQPTHWMPLPPPPEGEEA